MQGEDLNLLLCLDLVLLVFSMDDLISGSFIVCWFVPRIENNLTINGITENVLVKTITRLMLPPPGAGPIKIFQNTCYAVLFFKHCDWLKFFSIQSKCLKKIA